MKVIGRYKNGNYYVTMLSDGTKIRANKLDTLEPEFAENCDMLITTECNGNCPYCYEGCSTNGSHADLMNLPFLDTLHPFTELAINGNDLTHPQLIPFMEKMREKKVYLNMTVNQKHFERHLEDLYYWSKAERIHGLGISLNEVTKDFANKLALFPNAVTHVINGVITMRELYKLHDYTNGNAKILILGYKNLGRGVKYNETHADTVAKTQKELYDNLDWVLRNFEVVSFDNLALEQLNVRRLVSDDVWSSHYMGDDAHYTFYLDAVRHQFARNSCAPVDQRYPMMDNIDDMFHFIQEKEKERKHE